MSEQEIQKEIDKEINKWKKSKENTPLIIEFENKDKFIFLKQAI